MTDFPIAPESSSVANIVASLREAGSEYAGSVSGHSGKFTCPNPGHDDSNASFDVTVGSNGKAVFNCSPCLSSGDRDDWIEALRSAGVRWGGDGCSADLVDWGPAAEVVGGSGAKKDHGPESGRDIYTYKKKNGKLNFKVARINYENGSKRFVVRHTNPSGETVYSLPDDVLRTPLHLELFEDWWTSLGIPIYLTEGEKACEALNANEHWATTFHGGTNAPMHPRWTEWFSGFSEVRVWPDADEVGVEWAKERCLELRAAGIKASLWAAPVDDLEPSDDAYDAIERGLESVLLTKGDLKRMASLKPKPVIAVKSGSGGSVAPGGKQIVSATGGGSIDPRKPYPVVHTVEPFVFAHEVAEREFTNAEGVLSLRFNPIEQQFWLWSSSAGHYKPLLPKEIAAQVEMILQRSREITDDGEVRDLKVKGKSVADCVEGLSLATLVSEYGRAGGLLEAVNGVPFRNGWLDASTGLLTPLGPDRDIRWVVPAEYSPDASCPSWLAFLESLGWGSDDESHRLLRQWFGYLLSGSTALHKGMLLVGPKRAGKGTILHVAEALMGDGATSTSLDRFDPQRTFGLANMMGKALATIGDARWGRNDPGRNANLLSWTGGDLMPMEKKHKDPISLRPKARLMIASNETPRFFEASDALADRFVMLELTKTFYGAEDLDLVERLLGELPGIAKWSLEGLVDLNGVVRFSETRRGLELQEQVALDSSPVRRFVEEDCILDPAAFCTTDDLWDAYKSWRMDQGLPTCTKMDFGRDLKGSFPETIVDYKARVGGKRVYCKRGLRPGVPSE